MYQMIQSFPVIITLPLVPIFIRISYRLSEIKYPTFINSFMCLLKEKESFIRCFRFGQVYYEIESTLTPEG